MYVYTQSMAEVIIVFHYLIFFNLANTGAIQTKIKELCMKGSLKNTLLRYKALLNKFAEIIH